MMNKMFKILKKENHQKKTKLSRFEIEQIHRINLNPCLTTCYKRPVFLTQGHMQYVWDDSGRRYLGKL